MNCLHLARKCFALLLIYLLTYLSTDFALCFSIYITGLVLKWMKKEGGVQGLSIFLSVVS